MKFEKINGPQNHHLFRPVGSDKKVRDVIWVRFFKTGKGRLEESLKTTSLSDARGNRDIRIAAFLGQKLRSAQKVFLVEDKFPEFLGLKKHKSPGTQASMKNQWENHLKDGLGGIIVTDLNNDEWLRYVGKKRESYPDRKFFNDRKYLSMFTHWLYRNGLIQKLQTFEDVDPEIAEGLVYTDDQIKAIIEKADQEIKLKILCGLTMGMRIGEINSLEWSQIDFMKKTIYLPAEKTKIRKERTFGISQVCLEMLTQRKEKSLGLAVFASPQNPNKTQGKDGHKKSWARCKRLAGVPEEHRFHWLRHTFLTLAFKHAVNPALICEYAGLSLEEASKVYLHFTVEDTRIVSSLVKVQP